MDCNNPQNPLEVRALGMALGEHLSSTHEEKDYVQVLQALASYDDDAIEALGVDLWDEFAGMGYKHVAELIDAAAAANLEHLAWAFELGKSAAPRGATLLPFPAMA